MAREPEDDDLLEPVDEFGQPIEASRPAEVDTPEQQHQSEARMLRTLVWVAVFGVVLAVALLGHSNGWF